MRALTAPEAPALKAGSELLRSVGKAAVHVALHGTHESHKWEARWQEGLKAAVRFEEVPEAQYEMLVWLGNLGPVRIGYPR